MDHVSFQSKYAVVAVCTLAEMFPSQYHRTQQLKFNTICTAKSHCFGYVQMHLNGAEVYVQSSQDFPQTIEIDPGWASLWGILSQQQRDFLKIMLPLSLSLRDVIVYNTVHHDAVDWWIMLLPWMLLVLSCMFWEWAPVCTFCTSISHFNLLNN